MNPIIVILSLFLAQTPGIEPGGSKVYTVYPTPSEIHDTRAPKGYSAFYITHYGRHGSRYLENETQSRQLIDVFESAARRGGLTATGEALLSDLKFVESASAGHYGQITALGASEQKGLGARMAGRFGSVFGNPERRRLTCVSSIAPRCIMSMANFNSSLLKAYPRLDAEYLCGNAYQQYIIGLPNSIALKQYSSDLADKVFAQTFDFKAFASRFFRDVKDAEELIDDRHLFVRFLMFNASDAICIGNCPDLIHYFTPEEFIQVGNCYDIFLYGHLCNSRQTGRNNMSDAVILAEDFISRADAAVAGNDVAADIRFGHDSALLNFLSFLAVPGLDMCVDIREADQYFNSTAVMPMASNLQMVFYRHKGSGDVIVKVLYNEKEISLAGLGEGPYYAWTDLRAYFVSKIEEYKQ